MSWSLTEKELRAISILKKGGSMSVREIKRQLEKEGIMLPYTTVSSFLEKLHSFGILEREEVKSRGRYGKKYIYSISDSAISVDSAHPLVEVFRRVVPTSAFSFLSDSVAFVDRNGIITFLYINGEVMSNEEIIGKRMEKIHSKITAKFVNQIFQEMKRGKREIFKRVVEYEGRKYEKYYCSVKDSDGSFLGVLVISSLVDKNRVLPHEVVFL